MQTKLITLNGKQVRTPSPPTIEQLLRDMGLLGKRVAIECNGFIVPKSAYPLTMLNAEDHLEIVVAVGGG